MTIEFRVTMASLLQIAGPATVRFAGVALL